MRISKIIRSSKFVLGYLWMVTEAAFCILVIPGLLAVAYIMAVS